MEFVIIESPFAGNVEANTAYARACVADTCSTPSPAFMTMPNRKSVPPD
jgi:hypothetical protein